jgi:DNA-binding response OmpR family regulator
MSIGTVLVVEDDAPIRRGLVDALRFAGYALLEAQNGAQGLELALRTQPDLILLDVAMPEMDGFEVLQRVRKVHPGLPVIMLTARGSEEDRVRGLRKGADDYVVKPFSTGELLARVEAVLRRSAERPQGVSSITVAGREFDFERREVLLPDGERVALTERETELLRYLASNPGRAIARDELLRCVWGIDPRGVQTRTVDMHVARLRESLKDDPTDAQVVCTVRGKGYMLGEASATSEGSAQA